MGGLSGSLRVFVQNQLHKIYHNDMTMTSLSASRIRSLLLSYQSWHWQRASLPGALTAPDGTNPNVRHGTPEPDHPPLARAPRDEITACEPSPHSDFETCKKDIDTTEDGIWNGKVEKRDLAAKHKDLENTLKELNVGACPCLRRQYSPVLC